jgi:hypothetical protein
MFAGSMLGQETARPVSRGDGTTDLYIASDSFHDIFCRAPDPRGRGAARGGVDAPQTAQDPWVA